MRDVGAPAGEMHVFFYAETLRERLQLGAERIRLHDLIVRADNQEFRIRYFCAHEGERSHQFTLALPSEQP